MSEYRVRFEVFEGPLDLLLYLIKREEVDIYQVNLTRVATEFIEYLNLMRELDLDIAGEFVVMAATLMLIKSRELLPRDQRPEGQSSEEEELEDPRWELIRQLVEYKKFKDAAARLHHLEIAAENTFPRIPGRIELPEDLQPRRSEATIFDLLGAVTAVLKRFQENAGQSRDVFEDSWSVSEKIESLVSRVQQQGRLRFSLLFQPSSSRTEIVVTFLAILELVRLRTIVALQAETFGEIDIELAPPPTVPAPIPDPPPHGTPGDASTTSSLSDAPPPAASPDPDTDFIGNTAPSAAPSSEGEPASPEATSPPTSSPSLSPPSPPPQLNPDPDGASGGSTRWN